ncbi:MAG: RNA-directed DNA polymerase [Lewinella sp.]|nr:RNA-directed DNA polymerase [Lewinella sp.]
MKKDTRERHQHRKMVFCSINSEHTLCRLLHIDQRRLQLLAKQPAYKSFTVPKKDGGQRQIEAPNAELKRVLGRLNRYLQSVYYFEKSSAAFGFIVGVTNDDDRRNVITNARKHLGKPYLLNIDLLDFFHSISRDRVYQIFREKPFNFRRNVPDLLADLTTYQDHLPMGTPTSPVLSNFACRDLDRELLIFSQTHDWTYTRYADDMSFSAAEPILQGQVEALGAIIQQAGFAINPRKTQLFGPEDEKIVTGLLLTDTVTLAPDYLPLLQAEIDQLRNLLLVQNEQGELSTRWVEQFKKQLMGRLNFAGFVLRRNHPDYMALKDAYYAAIHPPQEEFGAISWRGFPYNL